MSGNESNIQDTVNDLKIQHVLDAMAAHVWIKDLSGTYIYTNQGCEKNLGIKPELVIGKSDYDIVEPQVAEYFLASDREALEQGKMCAFPRVAQEINGLSKIWTDILKTPIRNTQGEIIGLMGMSYESLDYSSLSEKDELYQLAYNDLLTGISNRVRFKLELERMLEMSCESDRDIAVMSFDIDFFQRINESYGHKFGDLLLKKVALLLQEYAPESALLARIDGDEFAIAFYCCGEQKNCAAYWIQLLQDIFNKPFMLDGHELRLSVSFGVTTYPHDADNVDDLLRNVDAAKNKAKLRGRNRYEFYQKGSREIATRQTEIQTHLHKAIEQNNFFLVYQGKYSLADETLCGYEALIRLDIPHLGLVSPAEFIPLAESSGLIIDIGAWVLEQACIQGNRWLESGTDFGHISVNVSVEQLKHHGFIQQVSHILEKTQFPAQYLEMEITESVLMKQTTSVIKTLTRLQELGISLSMDDFGTGYSSLSYLKDLPVTKLKIDRSFVNDLIPQPDVDSTDNHDAIIKATIALAKAFNLEIIAEGIETPEQAKLLKELGCHYAQGFWYHKPERFD